MADISDQFRARERSRSPRRHRSRSAERNNRRRSYSPHRSRSGSRAAYRRGDREQTPTAAAEIQGLGSLGQYAAQPRVYDDRTTARDTMNNIRESSQQDRRVYVGNLSYDVKWHHLKDFMRQAGDVLFADVLLLPNGMSKGCGIVEYATRDQAQHAVATLSNQNLMGRLVYVREDREAEPRFVGSTQGARTTFTPGTQPLFNNLGMTGSRQIYVSNLPYTVGWQDLKDLFRQAAQGGAVIRADVHTGPDGRPKGSGIVVFENPVDAHNAIQQFNGFDWHGRMLEVREDRFAGAGNNPYLPAGRGFANNRGPFMGSFARGGFSGGRGGSGFGFGGGRGYSQGLAGFDHVAGPSVAPNPFTDFATAGSDRSETIFVRNLPWSTSNDDLVELFTTIGKVDQAEIQYEPSGRSKGTGVVRFDTIETAETAINKFQGYQYGGRPLSLSFVKYLNSAGAGVETLMTDAHAGLSQDQIM